MTDTVRRSLAVYECLLDALDDGGKVIFEDSQGHQREMLITY
jgi:hypothetical protein